MSGTWIRKRFLFLIALVFVYAAFFLVHYQKNKTPVVLGTSANLQLFVEPQAGKEPLISSIASAQKEIDVEVYLLSDKDILASLLAACQRGVVVRVLLEQHPFGGGNINQKTKQQLDASCVRAQWSSPAFALTHEKTMVIDNSLVWILTQNLTNAAFGKNREYDIADTNVQDIADIQAIFTADWARNSFSPTSANLFVSPDTSRPMLTSLIASATQAIYIEMEVIDDQEIVQLLEQKAQKIPVQIIVPSFSQVGANKKVAEKFLSSGIQVKTMSSPYIHAKLLIADKKAYVGSVNLTSQSMDSNREVGISISQQDILDNLEQDFLSDWDNASPM